MFPVVTIGKRRFTLLFPDLMRALTDIERQALKNSIRKSGVTAPVITDEEGGVIDGANRLQIAAELELPAVPVHTLVGLSYQQKAELALSLNDARRHLKPAEFRALQEDRKERIARVVAARTEGMSTREIAEQVGVSQPQVIADLRAAGDKGLSPAIPERVKGRDGKTYEASKAKPKADYQPAAPRPPEEPPSVPAIRPTVADSHPARRPDQPSPAPTEIIEDKRPVPVASLADHQDVHALTDVVMAHAAAWSKDKKRLLLSMLRGRLDC